MVSNIRDVKRQVVRNGMLKIQRPHRDVGRAKIPVNFFRVARAGVRAQAIAATKGEDAARENTNAGISAARERIVPPSRCEQAARHTNIGDAHVSRARHGYREAGIRIDRRDRRPGWNLIDTVNS